MDEAALRVLQAGVWAEVCRQLDGISSATVIAALARRGAFARLRYGSLPRNALLDGLGGNPGFVAVALKGLALRGLVRFGAPFDGGAELGLTAEGRRWAMDLSPYDTAPALVAAADALLRGEADAVPDAAGDLAGFVAGPALLRLAEDPALRRFAPEPLAVDLAAAGVEAAAACLASLGWLERTPGPRLTPAGRLAVLMAPQYRYPLSYLPLLGTAGTLLFGDPAALRERREDQAESHVDRAADIRFSGEVFARSSAPAFFGLVLPRFDAEPLATQPAAIVDMGCGDGTLLIETWRAIAGRTARGRALDRFPLTMIGVEYSPEARAIAGRRLAEAGVPHRTLSGDIGDPGRLARDLTGLGFDPLDMLHVSKSVIHNRSFVAPRAQHPLPAGGIAAGPFAAADGALVEGVDLWRNLIDWFTLWKPWLVRHGMIAIEAHTVAPDLAVACRGRSMVAQLDLLHGLSCQYLLPVEPFRAAALAAGLTIAETIGIGQATLGHDYASLTRFSVGG